MLPASAEVPNRSRAGMGTQARSCSYAQAVAAARVDTSSFVYRLLTCRSTVRSLIPSCVGDLPIRPSAGEVAQHLDARAG